MELGNIARQKFFQGNNDTVACDVSVAKYVMVALRLGENALPIALPRTLA